jgi:mono/diheme cytochrome c family protein
MMHYPEINFKRSMTRFFQSLDSVRLRSLSLIFLMVFSVQFGAKAQSIEEGKKLFQQNCTSCHAVGRKVIGPALSGVTQRRPMEWILRFVKNSQAVIQSGDEYAVELYEKYNKTIMPSQNLTDDEIKSVMAYIDDETLKASQVTAATADAGGAAPAETGTSLLTYLGLFGLSVILFVVIIALNRVIKVVERVILQKDGASATALDKLDADEAAEKAARKAKVMSFVVNKKTVLAGILIFIIVGATAGWKTLITVGIQQGYAPVQPINFSHEIHAGINQINCVYCHSGAEKGRHATLPPAKLCMNCHNYVKPESPEIQKIYAALDYSPETLEYGDNPKPIEWIRVHNLPDFAYFNHSQHVMIGKVECQKCHGPVEEMAVLAQHSNLTMGWCINCHRETKVNFEGNDYYDKIIAAHDDIKSGGAITVANLGGIECAKCHY